jgi:neutral ceramidase
MTEQTLYAGHRRVCITPPVGTFLMGYASRTQPSEGVHDDLFANAVALSDGARRADAARRVVLVALDVCSLEVTQGRRVQEAIAARTGLAPDAVLLNFSHTHAGPLIGRVGSDRYDEEAFLGVLDGAVEAAAGAIEDLAPATLSTSAAPADVGLNRRERTAEGEIILGRNPEGATLGEVTLWLLARAGRADIALWSIPMHGTTLGGENLQISAEWMGAAVREVEAARPGLVAVFLQGCGADQNPYRGERSFRQVAENGRRAARAVLMALETLKPAGALPLVNVAREMPIPVDGGGTSPAPIHGLRLGDVALVGLGGEAFVEYALHARTRSAASSTMALGYTDGVVGYLPTAIAYEEGGYEPNAYKVFAAARPWDPALEGVIKAEIDRMLADLGVAR